MSAMAQASGQRHRSGRHETEQLLDPFLDALSTSHIQTIPQDTVLGAITHFLSALPASSLPHLVEAILASDGLWSSKYIEDGQIRHAISIALQAKVEHLRKAHEHSWLSGRRIARQSRRWLRVVRQLVDDSNAPDQKDQTQAVRALEFRTGLLAGMEACMVIEWQDERVAVEEEVIMAVAELDFKKLDPERFRLLCEVVNLIDPARLAVLDLKALLALVQDEVLHTVKSVNAPTSSLPSQLAAALARSYTVFALHRRDSTYLLNVMLGFTTKMRQLAESNASRLGQRAVSKLSDHEWAKHKTTLSAFLTPASAMIDIMLKQKQAVDSTGSATHATLAAGILQTLAAFSYLPEETEGGIEDYDLVIFGSLDILEATAGGRGVREVFVALSNSCVSADRAAFSLHIAEQLVGTLDGRTLSESLLPLCDQYLHTPEENRAFDRAHGFMLAVIAHAGKSDHRPLPQYNFIMETLPVYSQLLIQQYCRSQISTDRFKSAYPSIVEIASKTDDSLAQGIIDQLDAVSCATSDYRQPFLLVRISLAKFVPIRRLRDYLDSLARDIVDTPPREGRLELAAKAFGMVVHDLGDGRKHMGIEWWSRWKRDIEDRSSSSVVKAKL